MDEFLKKLSSERVESVSDALERKKVEWLDDLGRLMSQIRDWLADGEANRSLTIETGKLEIAEEDLGPYVVPAMTIKLRTRTPATVQVQPKGMRVVGVIAAGERRIVGASGRVDITSGPNRAMLLRFRAQGVTSWRAILDNGTKEELTRDTFALALAYVLDRD